MQGHHLNARFWIRGPNRVFGKTEDYGFLSVKKMKTKFLTKWRNEDWRFLHVKTEEWRPAQSVKIKCEDCILKCEDPKINSCWLDPRIPIAQLLRRSIHKKYIIHYFYNMSVMISTNIWFKSLMSTVLDGDINMLVFWVYYINFISIIMSFVNWSKLLMIFSATH